MEIETEVEVATNDTPIRLMVFNMTDVPPDGNRLVPPLTYVLQTYTQLKKKFQS